MTTIVEEAIFGTGDATQIAAAVDSLCRQHLGAGVAATLVTSTSVGCVFGVELDDGRRVAVKAYQPRWTPRFLTAVAAAQGAVAATGFPCPAPVAGPVPIGHGFAAVETYLPDPGRRPIVPVMLDVSAAGLAAMVAAGRGIEAPGLRDHPMRPPDDGLYPRPHSPLFDFEATTDGAAWIDEIAAIARAVRDRDRTPPTLVHGDWSARNVRLGTDRVLAAYDWDSLLFEPESVGLGIAAATWSALGVTNEPTAPSAPEVRRYISAYERARGVPLTVEQRDAARARALYGLAYTARCEHALDRGAEVHLRARGRLRAEGAVLLDD